MGFSLADADIGHFLTLSLKCVLMSLLMMIFE